MDVRELKHAIKHCAENHCIGCMYRDDIQCVNHIMSAADSYIAELEERIAIMQESMEALEKRNEPIKPDMIMTTSAGVPMSHCPNCDEPINQYRHPKFCGACGQAVKWE